MHKSDPSIEQNMLVSKFLSSVGHELRSPLSSIMGFTSLILKGKTSEISDEQREQPTIVYESSEDLLDLINDVMNISTIEAGKNELVQETFLLDDVVNEVISKLKDEVMEKGLQCKVDILPGIQMFQDKTRGIGPGLCLCEKVVNLTQGRIWAESEFGKGSVFTFNVPV